MSGSECCNNLTKKKGDLFMYEKRTDLAIEVRESFPKDDVEIEGVLLQKERHGQVWVTTVDIRNEKIGRAECMERVDAPV